MLCRDPPLLSRFASVAVHRRLRRSCSGRRPGPAVSRCLGGGSTFAAPLYRAWIEAYGTVAPTVAISYDVIGSGEGIEPLPDWLPRFRRHRCAADR